MSDYEKKLIESSKENMKNKTPEEIRKFIEEQERLDREFNSPEFQKQLKETNKKTIEFVKNLPEEEPFISKQDYERLCGQGKREDIERLLDFAMIEFKKQGKREGTIKVLNEYAKATNPNIPEEKVRKNIFSMEEIIDSFLKENPIFYDKNKILWRWDKEKYFYEQIDLIDLRISISEARKQGVNIRKDFIDLILERARLRIPEQPKNTWVQFKNKIYDYSGGEEFEASPKYFITNPIPFEIGDSEETPTIDRLFEEWVGCDYKKNLYEIIAYSITPNKFMQRLFALVGGGSNGKGTFVDLIQRIIGKENYVASEMRLLAERNFETSCLYKKLFCVLGEVGYDDLKNTNQIKKLTGEDDIRYEFKGKNIFSDINTATIICLTNSLPNTPDKSIGFYRRWLIIDFPNQFPLGRNPVDLIPKEELNNLMKKCLKILKKLWEERKFSNEGSFDDRIMRYEERSNPVLKFIEEYYEEKEDTMLALREFTNHFNQEAQKKHQRNFTAKQIGKVLRNEGFILGNRKINDLSALVIMNVKLKTIKTIKTIQNLTDFTICNSTLKLDSNDSNDSNLDKNSLSSFTDSEIAEAGYSKTELQEVLEGEEAI